MPQKTHLQHGKDHQHHGSDPVLVSYEDVGTSGGGGGGGIQFDTYPQAGDWLYVQSNDATAAGGSPDGYAIELSDYTSDGSGGGGVFLGAFGGGDVKVTVHGGGGVDIQATGAGGIRIHDERTSNDGDGLVLASLRNAFQLAGVGGCTVSAYDIAGVPGELILQSGSGGITLAPATGAHIVLATLPTSSPG